MGKLPFQGCEDEEGLLKDRQLACIECSGLEGFEQELVEFLPVFLAHRG